MADVHGSPKMKRFRFKLLHAWIISHYAPCRVADVGGGKGFLAYLLQQSGWEATVIDPGEQALPEKFQRIARRQKKLKTGEGISRIREPFDATMARGFDLIVGLHAHGCNISILQAARRFGCGFVLLPCCVIDEPLRPPPDTTWLSFLEQQASDLGLPVQRFEIAFDGQNIGLASAGSRASIVESAGR